MSLGGNSDDPERRVIAKHHHQSESHADQDRVAHEATVPHTDDGEQNRDGEHQRIDIHGVGPSLSTRAPSSFQRRRDSIALGALSTLAPEVSIPSRTAGSSSARPALTIN